MVLYTKKHESSLKVQLKYGPFTNHVFCVKVREEHHGTPQHSRPVLDTHPSEHRTSEIFPCVRKIKDIVLIGKSLERSSTLKLFVCIICLIKFHYLIRTVHLISSLQ